MSLTFRSYPYLGDFTGVSVTGNTLRTDGAMIKVRGIAILRRLTLQIGIAMGPLTWVRVRIVGAIG